MDKKRLFVVLLFVAGCVLSAGAGFWFGFREAWLLKFAADSLERGAMARHHLRSLAAGKPGYVADSLEGDVDSALIWGYELFHHPLRDSLEPLWGFEGYPDPYEKYAVRLADYRAEHPSPYLKLEGLELFSRGESAEEKSFYAMLVEGQRLAQFKLNYMVKRYASRR